MVEERRVERRERSDSGCTGSSVLVPETGPSWFPLDACCSGEEGGTVARCVCEDGVEEETIESTIHNHGVMVEESRVTETTCVCCVMCE